MPQSLETCQDRASRGLDVGEEAQVHTQPARRESITTGLTTVYWPLVGCGDVDGLSCLSSAQLGKVAAAADTSPRKETGPTTLKAK